jgi:hypothetical protein
MATLSVESAGDQGSQLRKRVRNRFLEFTQTASASSPFTIRFKGGAGNDDQPAEYLSPFWARGLQQQGHPGEVMDILSKLLEAEAEAYYWSTLDNPFFAGNSRASIKPFGATEKEFTQRGAAVVPLGHRLEFEVSAGDVAGLFCVLELNHEGRIRVISLPAGSDVLYPFSSQRIRLPAFASDFEAENAVFILLVSKEPRPLSSFLPRDRSQPHLLVIDSKGAASDLDKIGPGFSGTGKTGDGCLEELDPDAWDVARIFIQAIKEEKPR